MNKSFKEYLSYDPPKFTPLEIRHVDGELKAINEELKAVTIDWLTGEIKVEDKEPMTSLRFKRLDPRAKLPDYQTPGAVGMDLHLCLPEGQTETKLPAGSRHVFHTGLAVEIPPGYEGQIRTRSGLAATHGIVVLNSPGTIDQDYRGELLVILMNTDRAYTLRHGDRIAQLVIQAVARLPITEAGAGADLSTTARADGGLGSTGV